MKNKLLDLLTDIEGYVDLAVDDRKDRANIMDWVHQAMDIAVKASAHKWPEDKPTENKEYIVRTVYDGQVYMDVDGFSSVTEQWAVNECTNVTHWWELPEV